MKLHYSPTSPYVRKVLIAALEKGVDEQIERVVTNPWESGAGLLKNNPLSKIPCLLLDDGMTLFDSRVIVEYIDSLPSSAPTLFPHGRERWQALRQQAVADGIMDAAVLRVVEGKREASLRSADWASRQKAAIDRALDDLEATVGDWQDALTIGTISIAVALGYLDLRHAADGWRNDHPVLAAWHQNFAKRASYKNTAPPDGA